MPTITLLHGTDHILKKPDYSLGKLHNDYYCFNTDGLKVLNLLDGKHSLLNWVALLLQNRIFFLQDKIALDAKNYIIEHYSLDLSRTFPSSCTKHI